MREDLIERLRSAAEAYPEDVFGKTTSDDRLQHGDVVQRAAATMGRHMAPLLREAAAALEAAREDAAEAKQNGYELGLLAGAQEAERLRGVIARYERKLDAAIDQARGKGGGEVEGG